MLFQTWRRMAALFVVTTFGMSQTAAAQTPVATPIPMVKQADLARTERRSSKSNKGKSFSSEKKNFKNFSYAYLLPFGVGQFERDKTILGTALATTQAGFLLLYFDRLNAVRSSNADAADVMRGVNPATAGNDPTIVSFLDSNEKFTLQAQQQANMALIGFFALYTAGVVEAVFDPFGKMGKASGKRKKPRTRNASNEEGTSSLVQDLREEERESRVGVFYQPTAGAGTAPAVGLSVQKPF
ncbi:hypothetical protein [Oligoflexus tunisiensis]|uniref:hypothetical protein n=1 Tax=Oligoflexus tunisiensis TaxID=708132 RepID=UPI00114CCE95|nr:hypothetical protein [Oligoflexus tunisiensis]